MREGGFGFAGEASRALMVIALIAVVMRAGVALPEQCPDVEPDEARETVERATEWFERNQADNGQWTYRFDRDEDRELGGYEIVRHAGVLVALYQAANAGVPGALEVADRGFVYAAGNLVQHDDWTALGGDASVVPTGASALLVAALVERRLATGDAGSDDLTRSLGRFLLEQVEPSGAVLAGWDPATGAAVPDEYSVFFTGETAWALARLERTYPGEGWGDAARRVTDYLPARDDAEDRFPPTSDHWAAYAYAERVGAPGAGSDAQDAHARRLAGIFGVQVRVESQRWAGGWAGLVRRGPASGSGVGTLGEGAAALSRLAGAEGEDVPGLDERVRCAAGILVARQTTTSDPDANGAWFTGGVTRMDDQQHAVSALLAAEPILATGGPEGGGADPHGLLWLLIAFVAVTNPARLPPARSRIGAGLVVALVTGAAIVVALLATPLLDALDVSPASARVAAGAVVGAAAVTALVRVQPALDGLAAAGWLALALAAGADDGIARTALAALVATLLAVVVPLSWRRPWLVRVLAAIAVLVAVDLIVDGVLGV
ncbi:MAG TPA: hypothetical protein VF152_15405 [Acidimicrobiia bacterium]